MLAPAQAALRALTPPTSTPRAPRSRSVLEQLRARPIAVSDELTLKFFSHAVSRSVLSLVA